MACTPWQEQQLHDRPYWTLDIVLDEWISAGQFALTVRGRGLRVTSAVNARFRSNLTKQHGRRAALLREVRSPCAAQVSSKETPTASVQP